MLMLLLLVVRCSVLIVSYIFNVLWACACGVPRAVQTNTLLKKAEEGQKRGETVAIGTTPTSESILEYRHHPISAGNYMYLHGGRGAESGGHTNNKNHPQTLIIAIKTTACVCPHQAQFTASRERGRMNSKDAMYSWHLSLRVDRPVEVSQLCNNNILFIDDCV